METNKRPQVIVAQIGARMHYAVPVLLHRAGMLAHFFTDLYLGRGSWLHPLSKIFPRRYKNLKPISRMLGRSASLPQNKVTAFNLPGLLYSYWLSKARTTEEIGRVYLWMAHKFTQSILRQKRIISKAQVIYSYNGSSLELFRFGTSHNQKLILDQINPSVFEQKLVAEESSRWPDWETEPARVVKGTGFNRIKAEWELADLIIVNSEFARKGLVDTGVKPEKIITIPLGINVKNFYPAKKARQREPINFLFLGTICLRKGIHYALEGFQRIRSKNVSFTVAGGLDPRLKREKLNEYSKIANFLGPIPRRNVLNIYQSADVFVFPTISDGFGLTQLEALACGLPVITTPNCGAVVRDGVDGFIVPIRDSEALAEKIELLAKDPELLAWMSQNARRRAAKFSWEQYGKRLIGCIQEIFRSNGTINEKF